MQARTTQLAPASPARPSLSAARRKRRSVCCSAGPSSGDGSQDAQGGGGESGGGGDEGRHNPSPEGEEVLANLAARREQAARLNAIFFGADAQGVSDLEGERCASGRRGGGTQSRCAFTPTSQLSLCAALIRDAKTRLGTASFASPVRTASPTPAVPAAEQGGGEAEDAALDGELVLRDLPLWRVQWSELMGDFSVMHVHGG